MNIDSKFKTGFEKVGNYTYALPITEQYLKKLGLDGATLTKIEFDVILTEDKVILEAYLPGREQASRDPDRRPESNGN